MGPPSSGPSKPCSPTMHTTWRRGGDALPVSTEDVVQLAKLAGLAPDTLRWMSSPDPMPTPPPPRYTYVPLSDEEWSMVAPHWPTFNQSKTNPRDIVNALLMVASTGCGWGEISEFATGEAARHQMKRRMMSGVLKALPELLRGSVGEGRLGQFVKLAR